MKTSEQIEDYCRRHHYSDGYTEFWTRHRFCQLCGRPAVAPHHVRTRKAGGDDSPLNLLALCRDHHVEIHQVGNDTFGVRYPLIAPQITAALERPREVKV